MEKTYQGSCHCGKVRFESTVDLEKGTGRCNCSICSKSRFWTTIVRADHFRILQGEDSLIEYRFGKGHIEHFFCKTCGIKPFGKGFIEALGGTIYAINIACLDNITPAELATLPVAYKDGRNDNWQDAPAETGYL